MKVALVLGLLPCLWAGILKCPTHKASFLEMDQEKCPDANHRIPVSNFLQTEADHYERPKIFCDDCMAATDSMVGYCHKGATFANFCEEYKPEWKKECEFIVKQMEVMYCPVDPCDTSQFVQQHMAAAVCNHGTVQCTPRPKEPVRQRPDPWGLLCKMCPSVVQGMISDWCPKNKYLDEPAPGYCSSTYTVEVEKMVCDIIDGGMAAAFQPQNPCQGVSCAKSVSKLCSLPPMNCDGGGMNKDSVGSLADFEAQLHYQKGDAKTHWIQNPPVKGSGIHAETQHMDIMPDSKNVTQAMKRFGLPIGK